MEIKLGNVLVADDVKICKNIFSRGKGLRFARPLRQGQAVLFVSPEESCLHTTLDMFFVFFKIDAVWLNSEKEIIDIRKNVKPFTPMIRPNKPAKYVLELPSSSTDFLKIGDKLIL